MPLNKIKHFFVPHDGSFFELMQKQAEIAHATSTALCDMLANYKDLQVKSNKIKNLEHEGDQIMREIYTSLNKTFIVPIDHGDISTLASSLDDIVDHIDHISTLLVAYKIVKPLPAMNKLADILVNQSTELRSAVTAINKSKTYNQVAKHCSKIKELENNADEIYIHAITVLFEKSDPLEILKYKEILEHLESTTDKMDKAANHISDIVMRHS
ncbi:DUF47 family protein [Candidatus Micrarchaeota archaeon]|nr:DUF47 family protein [Candidatus Micrarchaeota archaeon]MBU1166396.1 DUF47 family protein [Candidatus Micrarchaeota archaeon]MBU1887172.1 DUF47 family protein [Candidatus Micrarchaeota archaeon]